MNAPRTEPYDVPGLGPVPMVTINAWAAYEAFRRLGFTRDQVDFVCCENADLGYIRKHVMHVRVQAQGRSFFYTVAPIDRPYPEAQEIHGKFLEYLKSLGEESSVTMQIYRDTQMGALDGEHFLSLSAALISKGFRIPILEN